MSLKLFLDNEGVKGSEIAPINPDIARGAEEFGNPFIEEKRLWVETGDTDLIYENITITKEELSTGKAIDIEYALESDGVVGTYVSELSIADGKYLTAYPIWRKVTVANITEAFIREDLRHRIKADEFIDA